MVCTNERNNNTVAFHLSSSDFTVVLETFLKKKSIVLEIGVRYQNTSTKVNCERSFIDEYIFGKTECPE